MDIALAEEILDQLHDFGVRTITFSGGEPTRHSAFGRLLRHAALEKKLAVGVLSNGVNVTDEDLEEIYKHARWLRLSIDGSPTVYGDIRRVFSSGKDAFEEVRSTIQRFVRLNNSAPRCKLSICYTIQKHNADDVPEMIKWVRSLSIPNGDESLTFKFAHGSNGFLCTAKQLRTLYSEVLNNPEFHRAANLPYLRWFLDRQSSMSDVAKGRPTESLYLQQPTRCFTPHLFTLIDPQGDVYPCCFLFEDNQGYTEEALAKRRLHCVGNLRTKTFRQLWDSTEYQQIRGELAIINPKTAKYAACGECTRHCNHNQGLSQLYAEYSGLHAAGGDADSVMKEIIKNTSGNDVWL
jgi:MoaA/NifB/PqqE/SkfB family radical SAM enzyme